MSSSNSKSLDGKEIARRLDAFRKAIPLVRINDFTMIEVLDELVVQVSAVSEYLKARKLEEFLHTYYTAEDLARDPAKAGLIPHVEMMRNAYEDHFGRPIPPRPKDETPSASDES